MFAHWWEHCLWLGRICVVALKQSWRRFKDSVRQEDKRKMLHLWFSDHIPRSGGSCSHLTLASAGDQCFLWYQVEDRPGFRNESWVFSHFCTIQKLVWGVLAWISYEPVRAQQIGMPAQFPGDWGSLMKRICIHLGSSNVCKAWWCGIYLWPLPSDIFRCCLFGGVWIEYNCFF